jgi:tetratricopeptide (TPR) repeat protein
LFRYTLIALVLICCSAFAYCQEPLPATIYLSWLQVETEQSSEDLHKTYQQLITKLTQLRAVDPQDAEYWALSGIIKSHYAAHIGGLTGLSVAKQAKDELQQALSMDPEVFSGIAYAELANLYYKTPNWPFSFGSDKMAERLFNKAVEINPQGLLTNLYFGRYWYEQHKYLLAKGYLASASAVKSCEGLGFCSSQLILQANNLYQKALIK